MEQTLVIKLGTNTVTDAAHRLDIERMRDLASQVAALHAQGRRVVLVSSGSVAAGRQLLNAERLPQTLPTKQMLSAIGQPQLMHTWSGLFREHGLTVGQVLISRADFHNRKHYLNIRDTLLALLERRVIPIINENDTVATSELRFGDNDKLAALVANLVAAPRLILLTDQQGFFTADPRRDKSATRIPVIEEVTPEMLQQTRATTSPTGTGGMLTKLQAAQLATGSGTEVIIASAKEKHILAAILRGDDCGSRFLAQRAPMDSRKRWMLAEEPQGSVSIDAGAAKSLLSRGASLLPAGIVAVSGRFDRGAVLEMLSDGRPVGVGLSNYSSEQISQILGVQTNAIESILGYHGGDSVIHRDNMTILGEGRIKPDADN